MKTTLERAKEILDNEISGGCPTIWLLKRPPSPYTSTYDTARSFVVVTYTEEAARALAALRCGDEGPQEWHRQATAVALGLAHKSTERGIKCCDFHEA